jgi:predicted PurR-regulated permease PerM
MKVRIEIDTKTFVRFWLVVIGFAFAIIALYSARTALTIIGIALFLALALNGPVSKLARRLPDRSRTLSTAIAFTVVVAVLGAVIFLVVPPIVQQTAKFIESAPTLVRTISEQWQGLGNLIDKYHIQPQVDQAVAAIQADAGKWATSFGRNFISGIGSAMSLFAATLLVLVLTFLMLIEGPRWLERVWGLYKDTEKMETHKKIVRRIHSVVSGYVTGQLTVSGIGSVCAGATVFLLSLFFPEVPANLALPTIAIAFTLSLIPMFGATIAGIIVSLLLMFNSVPAGIIFAVYFMIYQQIENNFISPTIQAKRIELSPLAVLVAVTIGLYMFGIAGGIISIPVAGSLKVLIEEYLETSRKVRTEKEKPLTKLVKKLSGEEA